MSKFTLKLIEGIKEKQKFSKLVINGKCQFDEYENDILKTRRYKNELGSIYAYMERVSEGKMTPASHFKDITPYKEKIKEYEFRTKHLRVYAIKKRNGKIVILGGYKNKYRKNLRRFRSIKKALIESKVLSI